MTTSWREYAIRELRALDLPLEVTGADEDKAVRDAYPFGERRYHPYKVWLQVVKEWKGSREKLRRFSGQLGGGAA